jgi:hypothetical protein
VQIRKPKTAKPRTEPVRHGEGSHGKRALVQAVMAKGYSKRTGEKAVNAVINAWKRALAAREPVEMPLGRIKVRRTPNHIRNMVHISQKIGKRSLPHIIRWLTYKDRYQIRWKVRPEQRWLELLQELNPNIPIVVKPDLPGQPPTAPLYPTMSAFQMSRLINFSIRHT